ncbi:MAG: Gmad2 immunoglobulin-like domain-containing protein [Longimicrobiales bacterium]
MKPPSFRRQVCRARLSLVAALVTLAACGQAEVDEGGSSTTDGAVCLQGGPFAAGGGIEVGAGGPGASSRAGTTGDVADRVGRLRWHRYDGCERFVMDLVDGAGEAVAGSGAVSAEVLRDLGVVRVTLRDVAGAEPDATDATFAGPLARAAYAVASPEGPWVYVDLHLGDAAEAAVSTLRDPARVVVDLRPGGGRVPPPAPSETRVVVLTPRPGPATYPLTVTGYARTFESNVVVRLEREGQEVHEDFTTATAWLDAWGHYSFTIADGPAARVVLHVGEYSARDGTWEGVAVPLDMR